jgi:NTP pyrophosphatase (non-canonical NTP hydrolase)
MDFDDYQVAAHSTAEYPAEKALEYLALGLAGEAGEVANKIKKILRGDYLFTDEFAEVLEKELGDCLWYLAELCTATDMRLQAVAAHNVLKLKDRKKRGKIKGSGDER